MGGKAAWLKRPASCNSILCGRRDRLRHFRPEFIRLLALAPPGGSRNRRAFGHAQLMLRLETSSLERFCLAFLFCNATSSHSREVVAGSYFAYQDSLHRLSTRCCTGMCRRVVVLQLGATDGQRGHCLVQSFRLS